MAEKKDAKIPKRRTQVKELPRQEKELSKIEQKKIKGGPQNTIFLPSISRGESNNT